MQQDTGIYMIHNDVLVTTVSLALPNRTICPGICHPVSRITVFTGINFLQPTKTHQQTFTLCCYRTCLYITVPLTFHLWSMFSGCHWNFWSISQTPFSGAPGPSHNTEYLETFFFKTNQTRWGQCTSVCTYSAVLVLIFLNDIVDCVQQLFYGARYVSAPRKNTSEGFIKTNACTLTGGWPSNTSSNITLHYIT